MFLGQGDKYLTLWEVLLSKHKYSCKTKLQEKCTGMNQFHRAFLPDAEDKQRRGRLFKANFHKLGHHYYVT